MANLTNQLIKDTYQYLLQRDGNTVQDGFGNSNITLDLTQANVSYEESKASLEIPKHLY